MPMVASLITNTRQLVDYAETIAKAAHYAFETTANRFDGREVVGLVHEYNRMLLIATKLLGPEPSCLFRPLDADHVAYLCKLGSADGYVRLLRFQITQTLHGFARYLRNKVAMDPMPTLSSTLRGFNGTDARKNRSPD